MTCNYCKNTVWFLVCRRIVVWCNWQTKAPKMVYLWFNSCIFKCNWCGILRLLWKYNKNVKGGVAFALLYLFSWERSWVPQTRLKVRISLIYDFLFVFCRILGESRCWSVLQLFDLFPPKFHSCFKGLHTLRIIQMRGLQDEAILCVIVSVLLLLNPVIYIIISCNFILEYIMMMWLFFMKYFLFCLYICPEYFFGWAISE